MLSDKPRRPGFTEEEAVRLAGDIYGVSCTADELVSERDQNFHLISETGEEFVLKVANVSEERAVLEFQNQAIERLGDQASEEFGLRVLPSLSGRSIEQIEGADGAVHLVRLLSWIEGAPLSEIREHSSVLLSSLGRHLGLMDRAFEGFDHPAAHREFHWDLKQTASVLSQYAGCIEVQANRDLVEFFLNQHRTLVAPFLPDLRQSFIHNDGNDNNVVTSFAPPGGFGLGERRVVGVVDFGDGVYSHTVNEVAIGAAYAMLDKDDPLGAAVWVVAGYHEVYPLTELEFRVVFPLMCARLAVSVTIAAVQRSQEPENEYLSVTEAPAWSLLERLADIDPAFAAAVFRQACGLEPERRVSGVTDWLGANRGAFAPVVAPESLPDKVLVYDLSIGSAAYGNPADEGQRNRLRSDLSGALAMAGVPVGVGRYGEARLIHAAAWKDAGDEQLDERSTVHLGLDFFVPSGSAVYAALDGVVSEIEVQDGMATVALEHRTGNGEVFFTVYRHLDGCLIGGMKVGDRLDRGQQFASVGEYVSDTVLPARLHFQILAEEFLHPARIPGVCVPFRKDVWLGLCPDPNLIIGIDQDAFPPVGRDCDEILEIRGRHLGKSLSVSYEHPLKIVRGAMQYLYDEEGRAFLDAVNNVPHVGHCHPRVVRAAQRQSGVLNTNTRYLHDHLVEYARRICDTMPDPLSVCFFVCTGSEANELALRMARTYTGRRDIITVDGAYHGNSSSLVEISPYKFDGPGGRGIAEHVHVVPMPDCFRGLYRSDHPEPGKAYAEHVRQGFVEAQDSGRRIGTYICESLLGCGGQVVLPEGYLRAAYEHVRAAGGVCIADEVQVGFGRVGTHFWGFETQSVVPDIVTLGKPMGNGHPLAAVVTTPDIANAFANGMEYFNTYGGNPVSCAIGMAVLDVIEDEHLQENSHRVGSRMLTALRALKERFSIIGDVRGKGLFIGIELVTDQESLDPAAAHAAFVVERLRDRGILISTDGPDHNVLKIKPPIVFTGDNGDQLVSVLQDVLIDCPPR